MSKAWKRSDRPSLLERGLAKVSSARGSRVELQPGTPPPTAEQVAEPSDVPRKYIGQVRPDPSNPTVLQVWDGTVWINPDDLSDLLLPDKDSARSAARRLEEAG